MRQVRTERQRLQVTPRGNLNPLIKATIMSVRAIKRAMLSEIACMMAQLLTSAGRHERPRLILLTVSPKRAIVRITSGPRSKPET